jgi:hypothetical protein
MGNGVGSELASAPRKLHLRTVLGVVLVLKLAAVASLLVGWRSGPFEEQYSGYLYVGEGHRYKQTQRIKSSPLERLAPFDGQWYREIASEGYTLERTEGGWSSYAFFPAFPALCALAGGAGLGVLAGGLILNQVLSVASGLLLFLLARRVTSNDAVSLLAVMCFFLYPTAGFLSSFYSESLFVFLLLSHILLFERGSIGGSVLAGVLAGLCRPQGALVVFWHLGRLADDRQGEHSLRRSLVAGLSPALGFLLFWGYIAWQTGSPMSLFEVQTTWGRHGNAWNVLDDIAESVHSFSGWLVILSLLIAGIALVLTRRATGSLAWTMLSLSMIAVPLATGSTTSLARFLLSNVPQYIVLGTLLRGRPALQVAVLCALGALQGMANVQMVNWIWVA